MDAIITVLIPFFNPGKYLLDAVGSIYHQSYSNWKMVLVDDGSTDQSYELIKPYLDDQRVSYVKHSINQGQAKSLNTGLKNIETPFFVQLDPDDWFYPKTLESLVETATRQSKFKIN